MKVLRVTQSLEATNALRVTYIGCIVNGVRFHTKDRDDRYITQNSSICVSGEPGDEEINFYGILSYVIILNYILGYTVILFKCSWFDTNQKKRK